jgi:hypothetical protein
VVSLPQFYEVISRGGEDIDYNSVNEYFAPVAKEKGFAWITTLSEFRRSYASGIQTHFRSDGHLTPKGNEVLANSVKPQLENLLQ